MAICSEAPMSPGQSKDHVTGNNIAKLYSIIKMQQFSNNTKDGRQFEK